MHKLRGVAGEKNVYLANRGVPPSIHKKPLVSLQRPVTPGYVNPEDVKAEGLTFTPKPVPQHAKRRALASDASGRKGKMSLTWADHEAADGNKAHTHNVNHGTTLLQSASFARAGVLEINMTYIPYDSGPAEDGGDPVQVHGEVFEESEQKNQWMMIQTAGSGSRSSGPSRQQTAGSGSRSGSKQQIAAGRFMTASSSSDLPRLKHETNGMDHFESDFSDSKGNEERQHARVSVACMLLSLCLCFSQYLHSLFLSHSVCSFFLLSLFSLSLFPTLTL